MTCFRVIGILGAVLLAYSATCWSEVSLDGSLGSAGALAGPDFQITENLGHRAGGNLFHSFGRFNLARDESATFSGSPSINNVISRVTGGSPSTINGVLRSSIPNANLYFLNPAGVFFGSNASLDVQGSFHLSTADYLDLKDGTRFSASSVETSPILTASAPETFGFLGDNPAAIELTQTTLEVPVGNSLSLIAGDIRIEGGSLVAPAGRIDVASVHSAGEVIRQDNDLKLTAFHELGSITAINKALVDTSGDAGGAMFIRSGELTLDNSDVISETLGDTSGKAIDIAVNDNLFLRNGALVKTQTNSAGNAGDLLITARHITADGDGSEFTTGFMSITLSAGHGGDIKVKTESLEFMNRARISTQAFNTGSSGDLSIEAERVLLTGKDTLISSTATTDSSGNAGSLTISTNSLEMRDSTLVVQGDNTTLSIDAERVLLTGKDTVLVLKDSTNSSGNANTLNLRIRSSSLEMRDSAVVSVQGNNANLYIEANDVTLVGDGKNLLTTQISGSSSSVAASESANTSKTSPSNQIILIAETITMRDGATVDTTGRGGWDMQIEAENILLDGGVTRSVTGFTSFSENDAGNISVNTANLEVLDGGVISAVGVAPGNGGDIHVEANNIVLAGKSANNLSFTGFHSESVGDSDGLVPGGDAGNITVVASNLEIHDGASISSFTARAGNAGNINIKAANILLAGQNIKGLDATGIDSQSLLGKDGGDISIVADTLEVRDGASIEASSFLGGNGGDINIEATSILLAGQNIKGLDPTTSINSLSLSGKDGGDISIVADTLEVRDGASIKASSFIGGNGGDINIEATNILLSGKTVKGDDSTGLNSRSFLGKDAGDISVVADALEVRDGASIIATTIGGGKGGSIHIEAGRVVLSGDEENKNVVSTIAKDVDTSKAGRAGNIRIMVDDSLRLDDAFITLNTTSANGGDITVSAGQLVQLRGSAIATSVADGKGNGGNIVIGQSSANSAKLVRRPRLIILDSSLIISGAAQGRGGNININSDFLFGSASSRINASSKTGIDGAVNINSPESNISGSIAVLPESFLNASEHLSRRCSARSPSLSSFVIKNRDSIPPGPDDSAVATWFDNDALQRVSSEQFTVANADLLSQGMDSVDNSKWLDTRSGCQ